MNSAPLALSFDAAREFRFVGGDASLDFVNTGDWTPAGLEHDRFTDYGRLLDWAVGAGVVPAPVADRLRTVAAESPREAANVLATARALRHVIRRLLLAVVGDAVHDPGVPALAAAVADFNGYLARSTAHLRVEPGSGAGFVYRWPWEGDASFGALDTVDTVDTLPLDAVLWPVARAAAALLTSSEVPRVRVCAGVDCGWGYVDRSRNGGRRWCEMEVCGTAEKERRRGPRNRVSSPRPGREPR